MDEVSPANRGPTLADVGEAQAASPGEPQVASPGEPQAVSRAERRDMQIQRIMDAAKTCFVRHGFQGASMQQICVEAGMSPGALYRYFASKEAIIEAITEQDRREDLELFGVMIGMSSAVDGIVAVAMAHMHHIHERGLAPLFAEIRAESMRNPAVARCCMENMGQVQVMLQAYLGAAIERGEIDPVTDLATLMATLMSIGEGLMLNDLLAMGFDADRLEKVFRTIAEAVLRPTRPATDITAQTA